MLQQELEALRDEISTINLELLGLLNRRARVVEAIHRVKQELGLPIPQPAREQQMLEELLAHHRGPFPDETICHLFREIFAASIALMESKEALLHDGGGRVAELDLHHPQT